MSDPSPAEPRPTIKAPLSPPPPTPKKAAGDDLVRLYYSMVRPAANNSIEALDLLTDFRKLVRELFYHTGSPDWDRGGILALILHTRDIACGKGEYALFYLLMGELFLCTLDEESKTSAELDQVMFRIMKSMVQSPPGSKSGTRPYGSWKDFRETLSHFRDIVGEETLVNTLFFKDCVAFIVEQLCKDQSQIAEGNTRISLLAKWAPRENSKRNGWQVRYLALHLAKEQGLELVGKSHLANYRITVSNLNRQLKTVQIAQCAGRWKDIDFRRDVTARTFQKQRNAFQYPSWDNADTSEKSPQHEDRMECRRQYLEFLRDCARGEVPTRNAGLSPRSLVRDAIAVTENSELGEREAALAASAVDLQWWQGEDDTQVTHGQVVPIIDTSCSMSMESDDPLCAAIGIGVRMAETSALGRRLITFGSAPTWVTLDDEDTLTSAVKKIRTVSSQGGTSDLLSALELVAHACTSAELTPDEVKSLCIVILSDASDGTHGGPAVLHERTCDLFRDAGLRSCHNEPYDTPHIVYWGLRTKQPLPCAVSKKGVSLVSGYHIPTALHLEANGNQGLGGLAPSPERALWKILAHDGRYSWAWAAAQGIPRPESNAGWLW